MGELDMSEFEAENRPFMQRLKVDLILEQLDENDPDRASRLRAALDDRQYTSSAIARVITGWGFSCSPDSVQEWRRRQ